MKNYIFDGSFEQLFCAVFEYFEAKEKNPIRLINQNIYIPSLLDDEVFIAYNPDKFERVKKALEKKIDKAAMYQFTCAFLSEQNDIFQHLFDFCIYVFKNEGKVYLNFGNPAVIAIAKMAKSVSRESHRMKAFIRFEKSSDGLFYQKISPDFNVIPLIAKHFKNRYADQKWIIYDEKRNYGLFYDLNSVQEISIDQIDNSLSNLPATDIISADSTESLYAQLWKDYFKSTNIESRKNLKLHIQHVPKRYWKYLTEKI